MSILPNTDVRAVQRALALCHARGVISFGRNALASVTQRHT